MQIIELLVLDEGLEYFEVVYQDYTFLQEIKDAKDIDNIFNEIKLKYFPKEGRR